MGYPLELALRYMSSKKRAFVSVGTSFAMLGVTLGVAALATVMSVTGGFQEQFREKVLGVNAHVLVLKYSIDFHEYGDIMKQVDGLEATAPILPFCPWSFCPMRTTKVTGVAPFIINPMMVTHGDRTATGVLLKGVDPVLMPKVLDLPKYILPGGSLDGLRKPGAKPAERIHDPFRSTTSSSAHTQNVPLPVHSDQQARGINDPLDGGRQALLNAVADLNENDHRPAPIVATPPLSDAGPELFGSITPSGGYKAQLPEDDVLPDDVDPDPCKSKEQVAKLPGVVIGRTLGKQLNVDIGDCVQITSPTIGLSLGSSSRPPIAKQFRVIAMFEAGFDQYDSKLVYTDLYEAEAFYEQGDSVTGVEMKVDDIDHAHDVAVEVDRRLSNSVYHTMDWMDLNHGLFTALLIQQIGMSVVLALIIVVAAFTVIATLIMVVLDKKKEIALLKALGAKDSAILRVFLYQGAIIGVVGTTAGLLLGYAVCNGLLAYGFPLDPKVYFISKLPVLVRPTEFIITGVVSILICVVATIYPAMYAAKLRPADGLRSE